MTQFVRTTLCLAIVLLLGTAPASFAEEDPIGDALDGISGNTMLEMVKELASDEMLGRKTGWKGGPKVEEWVAAQFANFGLHPADQAGAYLEPYRFASTNVKSPIACTVAGQKIEYGKDYSHLSYSGSGKVEAPVVFCGYGVYRPDLDWDDYAGVDVKGKIVIAIRGLPDNAEGGLGVERFIGYKSSAAADKGAVGFLLVENEKPLTGTIQAKYYRKDVPGLWLSHAAIDKLLAPTGKKIADLKAAYDKGERGKPFETGSNATMEVHSEFKKSALGNNVLARIDGRDPDLKKEIVIVGAHCDHLGVDPNGAVFNGADDNASGTAVLVHLADILSLNKFRPKRTIVFCAFTGEEQGLHGSIALATNSPFHGNVVAVLNMDMVGQGDPVVSCAGVGVYPLIGQRLRDAIPESMQESVHFAPRAGGGSDHWPFYERGVPAFAISTRGKHPNYHTPLDDAGNIKAANLEITAKVVGRWLVTLGAHEKPLRDPHALPRFLVNDTLRLGSLGPVDGTKADPKLWWFALTPPGFDTSEFESAAVRIWSRTDLAKLTAGQWGHVWWLARSGAQIEADIEQITRQARAGTRILSIGTKEKPPSDAVIKDCVEVGAIIDLTDVAAGQIADVVPRLGGHPAIRVHETGPLPPPTEGLLLIDRLARDDTGGSVARTDVVGASQDPADQIEALAKSGLDLSPGSEGRKRAREWLGGAFVRLLGK